MPLFKISSLVFYLIFSVDVSFGQIQTTEENSDEAKILKRIMPLNYIDKHVTTLSIPNRKYDSPFFCTEIEQYKNGFIINSITSNMTGREVEFTTNFWFYDTNDNSIKKLTISSADTIESIVSIGKGLFYSTIKNRKRTIAYLENHQTVILNETASTEIRQHIDTAKWIKLGLNENGLFVLSSSHLFMVVNHKWNTLTKYSLDDFYLNILKFRRSISMLPTKNVIVKNNFAYFLQEVVQLRRCNLFKLDISKGTIEEYFLSLDYKDNFLKMVNDFTFLSDNSLLVSAERLMDNQIVINTKDNEVNVWSYNKLLTTKNNNKVDFSITTALSVGDTLILASDKGLYIRDSKNIRPIFNFKNSYQTIKSKIGIIHFEFTPRSIKRLSDNTYLLGGMWGGLYLVDVLNGTLRCLDDVKYDKLKSIDISLL